MARLAGLVASLPKACNWLDGFIVGPRSFGCVQWALSKRSIALGALVAGMARHVAG